jgi:ketopantoate reductase
MEIVILGPGAVGTLLGGLFKLKGHGVVLKGRRSPPAESPCTIRIVLPESWLLAEGVRLAGPEENALPDAALVTLGRHHLHALRRPDFSRLTGGGECPVALFNCDPTEIDRLAVPSDMLRLCLTLMDAVKLQENDVELVTEKPVILYERAPHLDRLFRDLASFGFQVVPVPDARPHLNSLLVWQLLFLPVAMCNTTLGIFLSFPEGRELAASLIAEGCAAMEKAGFPMAALPAMDPRELAERLDRKPGSFESERELPDRSCNSLLQSFLLKKPTEAARLNRRIVEIASAAGLHLTMNWRVLQKMSRVTGLGFYRTPADLLRSLA